MATYAFLQSRRTAMANAKQGARDKAQAYADAGIVGDIDFLEMIAVSAFPARLGIGVFESEMSHSFS